MTLQDWLSAWSLSAPPTLALVVAAGLYADAWRRLPFRVRGPGRVVDRGRAWCFAGGLLAIALAVDGPPDVLAESAFSVHMVQHIVLQLVAAPLLLLGSPIAVLLRADPPWLPRRTLVRILRSRLALVLTHPAVTLGAFAVVLVLTHLTAFYEQALEHEQLHQGAHVLYLGTALMFWWPAIGVDPAPRRIGHLARLFYLMVSMPVTAFLGLAIANADRVLYASYAHPTPWGASPLADQQAAGTLMWVAGMFTTVPAVGVVLMRWLSDEAHDEAVHPASGPSGHRRLAGTP